LEQTYGNDYTGPAIFKSGKNLSLCTIEIMVNYTECYFFLKMYLVFYKKAIEDFVNDILLKQPSGKRLLFKLMHLRI
jgi:hypothetical protein